MRRGVLGLLGLAVTWVAAPVVLAQSSGQIDLRIPPPPPVETAPATPPPAPAVPKAPPPDLPLRVTLPAGTEIEVTLETAMSTRISKAGQAVTFRSVNPIRVHDLLEIPPEIAINGEVVSAKKPGGFGRGGEIFVKVHHIEVLPGQVAALDARLESADLSGNGRAKADSNKAANVLDLAQWTLLGTAIGHGAAGGKGAGYGAGAGALAALIIMMSRRGSDVYLEPGTPFRVILEQPVELAGHDIWNAQEAYALAHAPSGGSVGSDSQNQAYPEGQRPKLKRRPRP